MAHDIQLGYLISESGRPSTASCSFRSESSTSHEQRTKEWITHVPSTPDKDAQPSPSVSSWDKRKRQDWQSSPDILRGPPAKFRSYRGRWISTPQYALQNNLLMSVGFIELANACDFPANIWNQTPVPLFAAILMGIGGTIALMFMYCAIQDVRLSIRNLQLLSMERSRLHSQLRSSTLEDYGLQEHRKSIRACLAVNTREFGFELVDRCLMDIIMGFGCLLVGVGTLMAIGGNNSNIFVVSNLLSGYIGNAPAAIYGLINAAWSTYIWFKADTHSKLSCNDIAVALIWPQLSQRHDTIKLHAIVYGLTSLVAGAGSVMTATLWYGYVMLVPCVCASAWCNWLWRYKCGYSRPILEEVPLLKRDSLIAEIQTITLLRRNLKQKENNLLNGVDGLPSFLEILERYDLMNEFCLKLHQDIGLKDALFGEASSEEKVIRRQDVLDLDAQKIESVIQIARSFVSSQSDKNPLTKALIYRERYILELLGSWYYHTHAESSR